MATAQVGLEQVSRELDENSATRKTLEDSLKETTAAISALNQERTQLLVRIADGDSSARAEIDGLEHDKLGLERRADGLRLKIGELDPSILELRRKQQGLLQVEANRVREEMAQAFSAEALRHVQNQIACWRRGCREAYLLKQTLAQMQASPIDEGRKGKILLEIYELISRENGVTWNEQWKEYPGSVAGWRMTIMPLCPPDEKRDREELQSEEETRAQNSAKTT